METLIKQSDIFDIEMYKKSLKIYCKILKSLVFINIITFKIFEDRLLYQAEIASNLMIQQIELCFKK